MMDRVLLNRQYYQFILENILRPYQGELFPSHDVRIEKIVFDATSEFKEVNYYAINGYISQRPNWWQMVLDRLAEIYEAIDFSFFPDDDLAIHIEYGLKLRGVKEATPYAKNSAFVSLDIRDNEMRDEYNRSIESMIHNS